MGLVCAHVLANDHYYSFDVLLSWLLWTHIAFCRSAAGEDFSSAPVTVRFGPWQTTACVRIPIFNDSIDEDSEEFEVVVLCENDVQGLQVEEGVGSLPITIQGGIGACKHESV